MENIFYNSFSIIIGVMLILFFSFNIKKNKLSLSIITIVHGLFFLGFGIGGFFIPKGYGYITVLAMLALCVTMLLSLVLTNRKKYSVADKTKENKNPNTENTKEEDK